MLENLISMLSSTDFEDYGTLFLKSAEWFDETRELKIKLNIKIDEEPKFPTNWTINCVNVRSQKLILGYAYDFTFDTNHVLSWEFFKLCSISFKGKTDNSFAVVGALYKAHTEITNNWIPFKKYFNQLINLDELISGGFGQLVNSAPVEVAVAYEKVMQEYGFLTSRSEEKLPYFDERNWISKLRQLSTMIFDDSYIVAEIFEANPV